MRLVNGLVYRINFRSCRGRSMTRSAPAFSKASLSASRFIEWHRKPMGRIGNSWRAAWAARMSSPVSPT
jgi:hypothetical protein